MAGRREHDAAGVVTGVATALLTTRRKASAYELVAEALGGAFGGRFGSRIPDVLEPAVHSYHRNVAHSVTFATAVTVKGKKRAARMQARLRAQADEYAERRAASGDWFEQIVLWIAETACRVAGFVAGVIPGYLSHLVLDAGTPRGIPLLSARTC